jgi:hypothetical protein
MGFAMTAAWKTFIYTIFYFYLLKTFTSSMYNQIFTCKKNFLIANDETEQKLNDDCFIRTVLFNKTNAD